MKRNARAEPQPAVSPSQIHYIIITSLLLIQGISVFLSFDYLDNHSSDRLHTWRVYCWGPREVQCQVWSCLDERFSGKREPSPCRAWESPTRTIYVRMHKFKWQVKHYMSTRSQAIGPFWTGSSWTGTALLFTNWLWAHCVMWTEG